MHIAGSLAVVLIHPRVCLPIARGSSSFQTTRFGRDWRSGRAVRKGGPRHRWRGLMRCLLASAGSHDLDFSQTACSFRSQAPTYINR